MKSVLTIILLTVITFSSRAQCLNDYGIKFGAGISNQSWDYSAGFNMNFDNKIGISPRIFADFFNFPFLQFEGEAGFLRKGFTDEIPITTTTQPDGTGEYINVNNSLDYISVSLLAKVKYEAGMFTPYIIAGPQINYLISKNIAYGWDTAFDQFRKTNIGFSVGAGSELNNILPVTLLLEYRYERDFMDNHGWQNVDIKNYSHVILVGIKM